VGTAAAAQFAAPSSRAGSRVGGRARPKFVSPFAHSLPRLQDACQVGYKRPAGERAGDSRRHQSARAPDAYGDSTPSGCIRLGVRDGRTPATLPGRRARSQVRQAGPRGRLEPSSRLCFRRSGSRGSSGVTCEKCGAVAKEGRARRRASGVEPAFPNSRRFLAGLDDTQVGHT
jgi:hypothetical protein